VHYPSLETLLRGIVTWGDEMPFDHSYPAVCRAIAGRLFKVKSATDKALENARTKEWVKGLEDKEEKKELLNQLKEIEKEDAKGKPWFMKGEVEDENLRDADLTLSRVWKDYKDILREYPDYPMRGSRYWDLTEWNDEEKKPFEFGGRDEDMLF